MSKNLTILSAKEIEQIYGLPKFTTKQRKIYFTISEEEKSILTSYRTPITRVYFLLQLAYFKFKQQFFVFDLQSVKSDVVYLQKIYFSNQSLPTTGGISKPRRLQQQKHILELLNYKVADKRIRADLLQRACRLATVSAQAVFIFRDLCNWLEQERIVLPGYTVMQRHIVGKAIVEERKRLETIVGKHLSIDFQLQLKNTLIDKTDTGAIEDTYILSWLKTEAINFNSQTIRQSIKRKTFIQELYPTAKSITEKLGISNENIRYYANLIKHYTIGELRQFKGNILYVLLCCFLHFRYRQINDLLVEAFRYYVRKYEAKAKQIVKEYFYKYRLEAHHQLEKIPSILAILTNDSIDGDTPFSVIRQQVLNLLDEEKIHLLTNYINNDLVDEVAVKWNHYQDIQRQISYNLRHIFLHLELSHITEDNEVIVASNKFKSLLKNRKKGKPIMAEEVSIDCIPKYLKRHLYIENEFQINRYELMLYQAINRQIEAGNVFVIESFNNRSLEADLIDLDYWKSNKKQILEQIALPKLLQTPTEFLEELESVLEAKIKQVNNDISKGENKAVKVKSQTDGFSKWQLHYPESDKPVNHEIYRNLPISNIHSLLHWLEKQTDFVKEFTHVLPKNIQYKSPDINSVIACIVALGTNHGLADMANRSDIEYNHLRRTYQNFMRQSTLSNANTAIINATAKLPFFTHYNLQENILHSSSDGQKYSTRFDTIKARYSTKYFGLEKGVSLQTLVLNHIPVKLRVLVRLE